MYHDKPRRPLGRLALLMLAALAVFCSAVFLLGQRLTADLDAQGADALRRAVQDAAVQCYAVEGAYPESPDVLVQHYGLSYNHRDYLVSYTAYASNQPPTIAVLRKEKPD